MMAFTWKSSARVDLLEQFQYFEESGGQELADRYLAAVRSTVDQLSLFPQSGAPYVPLSQGLEGVRRMPVHGFDAYLIFYVVTEESVDVIRVLHGARDIEGILGDEGAD